MNILLTSLGALLLWIGVAVIAETWVATAPLSLFKHWQFYVAAALFTTAASLFEAIGRRER